MGKDATNNFFAENQTVEEQRDNSGLKGEPFKGAQFNSSDSSQFESSKGDFEHHGEQQLDMGISREIRGSGPVLMDAPPAGGMHGDKWQDQQSHLFKGETILRPQGEQSTTTTFKALEGAPLMEDHFKTAEVKSQSHLALPSDQTTFHDGRFREGQEPALHEKQILQPALHASKLEDNTMRDATIHGGRSRPLVPESSPLDQLPLAERVVAGVHAGDPLSSATLKQSSVDKIKAKKDKKDKKLEQSAFGQDAHLRHDDALIPHEHLKKDHTMISEQHLTGGGVPVERQERFDKGLADAPIILKKDEPISSAPLIETFIAAGENHIVKEEGTLKQTSWKKDKKKDKKLKKDKHFTNDAHLNKDVNIVDSSSFNRDVNFHDGRDSAFQKDSQLLKDSEFKDAHLSRDARFSKDLSSQDAFLVTEDQSKADAGKKGGKLKDKLHSKKEKLKAKLGMKKDDLALADAHPETHAPKGHEIATIKIPGIESGDRAAQEMVNHQAKAKKELNAELKEHAGHSDHLAPSEITHCTAHLHPHENRTLDSQPPLMSNNVNADQITRDQIQAKSDLNAEIRGHAGEFSSAGLLPSQHFSQDQFAKDNQFAKDQQFAKDSHFAKDRQFEKDSQFSRDSNQFQEQFFNKSNDMLEKDAVLAKTDVTAEINKAGYESRQLNAQRFAGFSGNEDALTKKTMLAKKALNAEINKAAGYGFFGATDHILPSEVARRKPGFAATLKEKALDLKEQFQPMSAASVESRQLNAQRFAGMAGTDDLVMKDHMMAKKDVNAEINKAGHGIAATDHIQPSDVVPKPGFTDMIKNAALAVKDQFFQSPAKTDARQLEAERLAGLSEVDDSLMKDNMLAKKGMNAEIKKAAGHGFFGPTDHIQPSAVAPKHIANHLEAEQLAELSGLEDAQSIQAKKSINAEIKKAGHGFFGTHDIHPSDVAHKHASKKLEGEQLAGLNAADDVLMQDNMLAKKDINAEIKKTTGHGIFGAPDHILPSDVGKPTLGETIKEKATNAAILAKDQANIAAVAVKDKANIAAAAAMDKANLAASAAKDKAIAAKDQAIAVKEQYKPSDATIDSRYLEAQRLAGFSADDMLVKESVLAKKDVNAEIKRLAGSGLFAANCIMPSNVIHSQEGFGKRIKDRAMSAATAMKGQFESKAPLEGEKLAGISETKDSLVKDNILAKKEVNAEIKAFGSDNIHPSEIAPASGGVTVIHDGRSDHVGSDRLKSEMDYEQAQGTAIQGHHLPSVTAMIKGTVATAASVAMAAASAVKGQFQAATASREVSDEDFPEEFQKADFEKELNVGSLKESDMDDDMMKDSILAKKDVNVEIKEHAPAVGDIIHPSDIAHHSDIAGHHSTDAAHPSMTEMIKERVANAASTMKETLHNLH